jgi:hypothetical protein
MTRILSCELLDRVIKVNICSSYYRPTDPGVVSIFVKAKQHQSQSKEEQASNQKFRQVKGEHHTLRCVHTAQRMTSGKKRIAFHAEFTLFGVRTFTRGVRCEAAVRNAQNHIHFLSI